MNLSREYYRRTKKIDRGVWIQRDRRIPLISTQRRRVMVHHPLFPFNHVSSSNWLESLKVDGRWFRRRDSEKLRLKSYRGAHYPPVSFRFVCLLLLLLLLVVLHNASRNYARASRVVVDGGENGNVRAKISRNCPDESGVNRCDRWCRLSIEGTIYLSRGFVDKSWWIT